MPGIGQLQQILRDVDDVDLSIAVAANAGTVTITLDGTELEAALTTTGGTISLDDEVLFSFDANLTALLPALDQLEGSIEAAEDALEFLLDNLDDTPPGQLKQAVFDFDAADGRFELSIDRNPNKAGDEDVIATAQVNTATNQTTLTADGQTLTVTPIWAVFSASSIL